jgi:hypothetical protein
MYFNRSKLLCLLFVIFVLTMAGCARTHFVVLRNVPHSPSFIVIPANAYLNEVEFANKIEQAIIGSGVKVVMRPSTREVTTEKTMEEAKDSQASGMRLTERYFAFEEFSADYIVQTYVSSQQVKITKRETKEVLTVFSLTTPPNTPAAEWRRKFFTRTLAKMGIPVVD